MKIIVLAIVVAFIGGLISLGFVAWNEYETRLLQNQEDQLLIISKSLSRYIEVSIENYVNDVRYLAELEANDRLSADYSKNYINYHNEFVVDIIWYNVENKIIRSVYSTEIQQEKILSVADDGVEIYLLTDWKNNNYIGFKVDEESGNSICLLVAAEKYYKRLISNIQIGTNGYVMVKNSDGKIIMHPNDIQWGLDVIEGRQKLYPSLDYDSLKEMVKEQQSGKEGISEYYSYWWTNPDLPRVKKVSAYAPTRVGEGFWIVSTVTDYDDLYKPIANGVLKIFSIFSIVILTMVFLFLGIIRLFLENRRNVSEINYLKELNSVLEEMHRSEEEIRHQQRLQIMGTMTGGIVHEFNNFLTPILGHAELLKMMFLPESEEYDSANEIFEAAERAKDVIRQISALSKKNVETIYKKIYVCKMIQRFLKMAQSVCPSNVYTESNIDLTQECILGNVTQINQVLLNIFVNAVQAIDGREGRIEITCRCVSRNRLGNKIKIPSVWKKFVCIDIKDNGCGMDKETIEHIFDPFFTTKKDGQGTGLGLALAEHIIMSHKGVIFVESELNQGTTFHIGFPVIENKVQQIHDGKLDEKKNIFVIAADNMKVLTLLNIALNRLNIITLICKNQNEVAGCLNKNDVDALFIDESVGDISGVEVCMSFRNSYPGILMFIMSGKITREIVEAKQNGIIDGYLTKPVSDVELIDAVRLGRQRK